jgi:hypothetical protein
MRAETVDVDVHPAGGVDEASSLGNHQEGAREIDVHAVCFANKTLPKSIYRNFR